MYGKFFDVRRVSLYEFCCYVFRCRKGFLYLNSALRVKGKGLLCMNCAFAVCFMCLMVLCSDVGKGFLYLNCAFRVCFSRKWFLYMNCAFNGMLHVFNGALISVIGVSHWCVWKQTHMETMISGI